MLPQLVENCNFQECKSPPSPTSARTWGSGALWIHLSQLNIITVTDLHTIDIYSTLLDSIQASKLTGNKSNPYKYRTIAIERNDGPRAMPLPTTPRRPPTHIVSHTIKINSLTDSNRPLTQQNKFSMGDTSYTKRRALITCALFRTFFHYLELDLELSLQLCSIGRKEWRRNWNLCWPGSHALRSRGRLYLLAKIEVSVHLWS